MATINKKIKRREGTSVQINASKHGRQFFYDTTLESAGYYKNDLTQRYLFTIDDTFTALYGLAGLQMLDAGWIGLSASTERFVWDDTNGAILVTSAILGMEGNALAFGTDLDTYLIEGSANQLHAYLNGNKCYAFSQGSMDIYNASDPDLFATLEVGTGGLLTISNQNCAPIDIIPQNGIVRINHAIWAKDSDGLGLKDDAGNGPTVFDGGAVTNTSQPSFLVYPSANIDNQTGDGTEYTVAFDTEIRDQGSCFATNTFTAPKTGVYHFDVKATLKGLSSVAGHTGIYMMLVTSNRTYTSTYFNVDASMVQISMDINVDADMDINDTAVVHVLVAGGTKVVDVCGGTDFWTYFSGHLVC